MTACCARTPAGLAWARPTFPAGEVSLRSSSSEVVAIVETGTGHAARHGRGRPRAVVRAPRRRLPAPRRPVPRARARPRRAHLAEVEPFDGDWYTQAQVDTTMAVVATRARGAAWLVAAGARHGRGHRDDDAASCAAASATTPCSTTRRWPCRRPASAPRPCGSRSTPTCWPRRPTCSAPSTPPSTAMIAVLPLLAMCDRWDLGGLSTPFHPDLGGPAIFVYDGHPGGVGITRRGHAAVRHPGPQRPRPHRALPVQRRLPLLRAVAEVRQPQRAARQVGGGAAARRAGGRRDA